MTFVNTINGKLINLSLSQEIIFYNIDIGEESLGIKCECQIGKDEFLLGFFKTYEEACDEFQVIFLKPFYKFDISFRDLLHNDCEEFKEFYKTSESKTTNDNFHKFWEESEKFITELYKKTVFEECLIEM